MVENKQRTNAMNFARTNLRNPLACPSAAVAKRACGLGTMASGHSDRLAASASPAPVGARAPGDDHGESRFDQIGAGVMILGFLVLALFG
jgi:hypothetical protein